MPNNRHRDILEKTLLATSALFLLVGIIALGFLQSLSKENRALVVITASAGTILCFAAMISVNLFWKWLRKRTWRRAMLAWKKSTPARNTSRFHLDCKLSENELFDLAVQTYARLGYICLKRNGSDDTLRLVNPEGMIELVTCKRQPAPVDILSIHNLQREMKKMGAVCGYFWSPAGFTTEAVHWARQKPIVLADQVEIGRLVDCARENGSSLLESRLGNCCMTCR